TDITVRVCYAAPALRKSQFAFPTLTLSLRKSQFEFPTLTLPTDAPALIGVLLLATLAVRRRRRRRSEPAMPQNLTGSTSALVLAAIAACGGESGGADAYYGNTSTADAATTDGGTSTPGQDVSSGRDGAVPSGPTAPGWNAPFALDPTARGLDQFATWDSTHTEPQG